MTLSLQNSKVLPRLSIFYYYIYPDPIATSSYWHIPKKKSPSAGPYPCNKVSLSSAGMVKPLLAHSHRIVEISIPNNNKLFMWELLKR